MLGQGETTGIRLRRLDSRRRIGHGAYDRLMVAVPAPHVERAHAIGAHEGHRFDQVFEARHRVSTVLSRWTNGRNLRWRTFNPT
jgi:hypothetical protein